MRAVWQLWLQLWKRMPLLAVLPSLIWLMSLLHYVLGGPDRTADLRITMTVAVASWMWHISRGQLLLGLCRPESFLLPGFRRRLAGMAALDALLWVVLPALPSLLWQGAAQGALVTAGLLLVAALGIAAGCGRRVGLLIWAALIAAGWKPQLAIELTRFALQAWFTTPLLVLTAAMTLRVALAPLLRIEDREPDTSPLESVNLGRASTAAGTPPRGPLNKRLAGLFDRAAQQAMERALLRYRQDPRAAQRMVLIRRLLLPHDNPQAIAMRLALVGGMAAIYFFAVMQRQRLHAAAIGAYAILLAMARFPQLGRGLLRMRPNLADLYLTLAPTTRRQYQKLVSDALLVLVPISVLTALAYALLGSVLIHATDPVLMLLTAAIVAASSSLVGLATHLIGPENTLGRSLVNIVVILGSIGTYWFGYELIAAMGYAIGSALLALVTLSFGGAVWYAAQREYQRRAPRFDAPLS
jgi:hypothetical protein